MKEPETTSTKRHPIGVVADRTGLSQDVLRVWERRYGAVTPERGPGHQRLYSDADIAHLRLLQEVTLPGRSIGQMARLSTGELAKIAGEDATARSDLGTATATVPPVVSRDLVESAIARTRALDGAALEHELRRAVGVHGVPFFLDMIATPLLRHIGDEWHAGRLTLAQEHLASAKLQGVLADIMRSMAPAPAAPSVLLATPAGERHVVGALLAAAAAAAEGWSVVFLGADLPASEIAAAAIATGARAVGISLLYIDNRERTLSEVNALRTRLPADVPAFVGGAASAAITRDLEQLGMRVVPDLAAFRAALRATLAAAK